jgi:hypothetical protein
MQCTREVMKPMEDGLVLNFDSIVSSTPGSRSVLGPCSSRVASFSLVYSHTKRARSWRGAMRFDKKSCNTIIDVKPFSIRNWILCSMGS